MPSLNRDFLSLLQDDFTKYPSFIETGTLEGETIFAMEPHFTKLYTIELSSHYHENTKNAYTGQKISFLEGDSSLVFPDFLPTIDTPAIFFLDGHWCSGDTARGSVDCPLVEEVTHITNLFKQSAIVIIDDARLFGLDETSGQLDEDWSAITKDALLAILGPRIEKVYSIDSEYATDDVLVVHIRALA